MYEVYRNVVTLYGNTVSLSCAEKASLTVFAMANFKTKGNSCDEATLNPPYPGGRVTYIPEKPTRSKKIIGFLQWLNKHPNWFTEIDGSSAEQEIQSDSDAVVSVATDSAAASGDSLQKALKEQEQKLSEKLAAEMEKKFVERAAAERDQIKTMLEAKLAESVKVQTELITQTISTSISNLAARIDSITLQSTGAQDNSSRMPDAGARVTSPDNAPGSGDNSTAATGQRTDMPDARARVTENAQDGSREDRSTATTERRTDTGQPRASLSKRARESDMEDGGNQSMPLEKRRFVRPRAHESVMEHGENQSITPGKSPVVKQIKSAVLNFYSIVGLNPTKKDPTKKDTSAPPP